MQELRTTATACTIRLMEPNEWIAKITTDTTGEIAKKADIPKRTLQHQLSTGKMSVENLVKIGAAYAYHPIETLIEWGIIDEAWRNVPNIRAAIKLAPSEWIADEALERMLKGDGAEIFDKSADDLAEQRKLSVVSDADDMNDGTVRPFDYSEYAADSSEDETEARLERGEDLID